MQVEDVWLDCCVQDMATEPIAAFHQILSFRKLIGFEPQFPVNSYSISQNREVSPIFKFHMELDTTNIYREVVRTNVFDVVDGRELYTKFSKEWLP